MNEKDIVSYSLYINHLFSQVKISEIMSIFNEMIKNEYEMD